MRHLVITTLLLCAALIRCGHGPDGNSGGDGKRNEAVEIPLETWITDETGVNYGGGDRTDWKKIVVPRDGTIHVDVAVDEKDAAIIVALYDRYGHKLIEKMKARGTTDHVKFEGDVGKGKYFIQILAKDSEDKSVYQVWASMEGGAGIGDIPPPE